MKYPKDWRIEEEVENDAIDGEGDLAVFYSPLESRLDDYEEKLWLSVDDLLGENMTLEEYTKGVIRHNNDTVKDFKLLDLDTDNILLAGQPAYRVVSTETLKDETIVKRMELGTIISDKVYYLTYYANEDKYDDYFPVVDDI